jgi:hypothetical protein
VYNKSQAPALAVEAHEDQPARGFDR